MAERQEELWMSRKDRDRLKVLHEVRKRHITQVQAGKELAISPRWVRELLRRMKARGDRAVVHGLRGRRSNRRLPESRAVDVSADLERAKELSLVESVEASICCNCCNRSATACRARSTKKWRSARLLSEGKPRFHLAGSP